MLDQIKRQRGRREGVTSQKPGGWGHLSLPWADRWAIDGCRERERIDQKLEEEVENREGREVSDVRTSAVCLLHASAI